MKGQFLAVAMLGLSLVGAGCTALDSESLDQLAAIAAESDSAEETTIETDGADDSSVSNAIPEAATVPTTPAISNDGRIQVMLPSNWQTIETTSFEQESNIVLQLIAPGSNLTMGFMAMPKVDGLDSENYADLVVVSAEAVVGDGGTVTPTDLTTVNGMPVIQYEGLGEFGGTDYVVISTGIETEDTFYSIVAVGDQANFNESRDEINQIIESFEVVGSVQGSVPGQAATADSSSVQSRLPQNSSQSQIIP